jgi:hypothetical protein
VYLVAAALLDSTVSLSSSTLSTTAENWSVATLEL